MRRAGRTLALLLAWIACGPGKAPEPGPVRLLPSDATASIGSETRLSLILKPPELPRRRFDLVLPAEPTLAFGFGLPNASLAAGARPALFEVAIETASGGRRELLQRRLDPAEPSDRRWFDARLELPGTPGERASLEFAITPEAGEGPTPMAAYANPVVYPRESTSDRPNVVVVSIDTLRARSLGSYGYARDTSPFIDALAARGALFENAITTSVTTGPSHMSLFTGLYPVNHGLTTGLEYKAARVATLAGRLRDAGYQTAAFTEDGYIVRTRGFGDGFSEYTENRSMRQGPGEVRLTFGQAEEWMERAREPFYLFVHTYQVHAPYRPPGPYRTLYADDGLAGPEHPGLLRQRDNYDREIRFVDDQVQELLAALEVRGVLARTLVVLLSDHGEEFHEHGYYQHGGALFEETLRIPMIFVGPGIPPGRHATQVSLIDVLPTVLDYAKVPAPAELDGISLLPAMRGSASIPERRLFAEARGKKRWLAPYKGESWSPPLISVRTQHEKFIVHRPSQGAAEPTVEFDLRKDALEASPRVLEGAEREAAEATVDAYLVSRLPHDEKPRTDAVEEIDPELRERLEQLGYLD